jgi:hypothetical protein
MLEVHMYTHNSKQRLSRSKIGSAGDLQLILGEAHLRAVLTDYQAHYNTARPHQSITQRVRADDPTHRATVTASARGRSAENPSPSR